MVVPTRLASAILPTLVRGAPFATAGEIDVVMVVLSNRLFESNAWALFAAAAPCFCFNLPRASDRSAAPHPTPSGDSYPRRNRPALLSRAMSPSRGSGD